MTYATRDWLDSMKMLWPAGTGIAVLAFSLFTGTLNSPFGKAQDGPKPSFEVTSVKQSTSARGMSVGTPPGFFYARGATLKWLIATAYSLQDYQISGGPNWIGTAIFDVEGKTAGPVSRDQFALMLRSLIEDRFRLKFHRETREIPVLLLLQDKGGHKLQQAKDEKGNVLTALPQNTGGVAQTGKTPPPGMMSWTDNELRAGAATTEGLARALTGILKRKVINKTEVAGLYDIALLWTPGIAQSNSIQITGTDNPPATDFAGPSIFVAIREQLGLKLEPDRGPGEFFVIDSAEMPTEN